MRKNVAIDGPAGAGKSTIARKVAAALHCIYVDTGAMYRAMALYMIRKGIDPEDSAAISAACRDADISISYVDGVQAVLLAGEDVSGLIRTPQVSDMASRSSANGDVRRKLVELQQDLAAKRDVVMDGRDIGTVVLPDARVKIYLTASVEVRAMRRFLEMQEKGETCDLEATKEEIRERDHRDMTREISPLRQAEDAVLVDSSDLTIDETVEKILSIYKERTKE